MKFFDIDKIEANSGVKNKYLLTTVVAARARKLSEGSSYSDLNDGSGEEKFISRALAELESNSLSVTFPKEEAKPKDE